MIEQFGHFYRPDKDTLERLLKDATLSFDANVLLNLYRYSKGTRTEFMDVLKKVQDRSWLTHQAALEFHRNRLRVMADHRSTFKKAVGAVDIAKKAVETMHRAPRLDVKAGRPTDKHWKAINDHIALQEAETIPPTAAPSEDPVLMELQQLFEKSVGPPYAPDRLTDIHREGKQRYEDHRPPGFSDADKPEPDRYGDLVLWKQLIDHANKTKRDLVLITDDSKEDWWLVEDNKRIGPHPALVEEMTKEAGRRFYAYSPQQFIERVGELYKKPVSETSINEVRSLPRLRSSDPESISFSRLVALLNSLDREIATIGEALSQTSSAIESAAPGTNLDDLFQRRVELSRRLTRHLRDRDDLRNRIQHYRTDPRHGELVESHVRLRDRSAFALDLAESANTLSSGEDDPFDPASDP